jgi:prepilin-type N-terminal cleavage/methylation domain-containing protein
MEIVMHASAKRRGFSLMELLVVMVIIGLLVSMLFPVLMIARERGRRTKAETEVRALELAWRVYYQTYDRLPSGRIKMTPEYTQMLAGKDVSIGNEAGIAFMDVTDRELDEGLRDPWYWQVKAPERSLHLYQLEFSTYSIPTKWTYQTRVHCMNHNRGKY